MNDSRRGSAASLYQAACRRRVARASEEDASVRARSLEDPRCRRIPGRPRSGAVTSRVRETSALLWPARIQVYLSLVTAILREDCTLEIEFEREKDGVISQSESFRGTIARCVIRDAEERK